MTTNPAMRFLRDLPIKRKLTFITMLTSGVALLLACAAFVSYELIVFKKSMISDDLSTAKMIGDNSSAALAFNDPASAEQTLKALSADPHIVAGAVYARDGKLFARYQRADVKGEFAIPPVRPDGHEFGDNRLEFFRKISLAGENAGTVYLRSDLEEMRVRLWRYALIVVVVVLTSFLAAFLLSTKLQVVISEPISQLVKVAGVVATERNYSIRAVKQSEDELGRLIDGFNEMLVQIQGRDAELHDARDLLEKRVEERTGELQHEIAEHERSAKALHKAHKQLLDASRQAGMAEVATGVLHNVGNVLNSVNVSATLIADTLRRSRTANLAKVVALVREHEGDLGAFITADARGRQIPVYLGHLSEHLNAEQAGLMIEAAALQKNVGHIRDIVAMQQSYANASGVTEIVRPVEMVEDALRMNAEGLARHKVRVVRTFEAAPEITVEKHKVLQILVNLMRNAQHACDTSGHDEKLLTLHLTSGPDRVCIVVTDNGVGIAPENLTRIFSHGFTTKKDGHGFGLHSAVLSAREMGGDLRVQSDGPGRGAAFTLELPHRPASQKAEKLQS